MAEGDINIPDHAFDLVALDSIECNFPTLTEPTVYTLLLSVPGTDMKNQYELYCYPQYGKMNLSAPVIGKDTHPVSLTTDYQEAVSLLSEGKRVLYLPQEVKESIEGFYCTDFWCYPMFRDICEWMKKPVAVGTMGLLIQKDHPALASFPSHKYSTPQWYQIVSHSDCAILDDTTDKSYRPIVQMVDNFERNHKLGILFEGKAGNGRLMICTSRLSEIAERPEVKQFAKSLLNYMTSDAFDPQQELDLEELQKTFG